jgi:teichuronic acid exporter
LAVKNRTKLYFKIELFTKLFAIPTIIIGIYFGINAMLIALSITSFLAYLISFYFTKTVTTYPFQSQLKLVVSGLFLLSLSEFLAYGVSFFEINNLYLKLLTKTILICFVYLIGLWLLFSDLITAFANYKKRNRSTTESIEIV